MAARTLAGQAKSGRSKTRIAVIMNARDVYRRPQFTEEDIRREIEREDKRR